MTTPLTPLAEADLEEIWVYTLHEWSLEQANSYINDVTDAFEGLRDGSKRGRFTDIRPGYLKYAALVTHIAAVSKVRMTDE
ncbi:type II toxin-antitoxin system RelE/ParE family toxin [Brucella anthropi]|uniref:type II toxin-antitoxin system RelE/ParE family toxin n=1 Tax=Brucella anthropi TaxID=529 RepID=UPI002166BC0D|nr:type II toxin-antitoxin system RelE/ParE family toxin [Brucella anthropi]UVV70888.1 type II toxin-antitoxin system RelE/ParE family toxin [Brucella anthropi]